MSTPDRKQRHWYPHSPLLEPPRKRRRPALACVQCRRRKIRCDQNRPCSNCTKSRIPDCSYPPTHTPGLVGNEPASLGHRPVQTQVLAPRAAEPVRDHPPAHTPELPVNGAIPPPPMYQAAKPQFLPPRVAEPAVYHPPPCQSPWVANGSRSAYSLNAAQYPAVNMPYSNLESWTKDDQEILDKLERMEEKLHIIYMGENQTEGSRSAQKSDSPARDATSNHRFGNQSNWMNYTSLYSKVLRVVSQAQAEKTGLHESIVRCKTLGDRIDTKLMVDSAPEPIGTRIPDKAQADGLLEAYFKNFEGPLRVLHIPSFRAEYERYWHNQDAATDLFVLQLQVCMALGAMARRDCLDWRNAASQWLLEAQRWLYSPPKKGKRQMSFEELQLSCLVCIAEANDTGADHMHQCWVTAGDLVRKAMSFGLHRDPTKLRNMSVRQAEMRRRLWATILELNLLLSLQAGQSPLISASDYDSSPPRNFKDEELDHVQRLDPWKTINPGKVTDTTMQAALFHSFNIRLEIVYEGSNIGHGMSYDEILRLHDKLNGAYEFLQLEIANCTSFWMDGVDFMCTQNHASLSEIIVSRYLLALHLPVLGRSIKDRTFHFSRAVCAATSIEIADHCGILDYDWLEHPASSSSPIYPEFNRKPTFRGRYQPTCLFVNSPGVFRHIASQAIFSISLEAITFREEKCRNPGALPTSDPASVLRHLKSAKNWAANRIRAGLTDVRTYCFISACIAYADALRSRSEIRHVNRIIVEAALQSSKNCLELLNGVAENLGVSADNSDASTARIDHPEGPLEKTAMLVDWFGNLNGEGLEDIDYDDWTLQDNLDPEPWGGIESWLDGSVNDGRVG